MATGAGRSDATAAGGAVRFDVFLSYSSHDTRLVERVAERLKGAGLEPWLDSWCLTPGGRWQEEIAVGLAASSSCAAFLGGDEIGAWEREELAVAQDRAAKDRAFRLFLVLLPGAPERFEASTLSPFLSTRTWVDLRAGVHEARSFQALINAVKGVPQGPQRRVERSSEVCPYRGLQPFDEDHAEFFFGRDADVQRLIEKLKGTSFLAVLGPSGGGKSSVVRAGLIPALRLGSNGGEPRIEVLRPGAHPLEALAARLAPLVPDLAAHQLLDELTADPRTLRLYSSRAERTVWVVDQCEEVFTLCRDERERRQFLVNLLHAATADGPATVILTLRADFYPHCAAYPELAQLIAAQQFLVGPMDEEGLRQAIEEPAHRVGLEFEPGLVATILADLGSEENALPLLEHALLELWERRRGQLLTLEAYAESGGVKGAIARRAEHIFTAFSDEQQQLARRAFLRLTQPGEGTEDTRRRAAISELAAKPEEELVLDAVLQELVASRMLVVGRDDEGRAWVDVSHEALIRGWPRLRLWLDEDRTGLRVHRRVTEAALEWERDGRSDDVLYRGGRLTEALEWRDRDKAALNELETEFLDASAELRTREQREAEDRAEKERAAARKLAVARSRARRLRIAFVLLVCLAVTIPGIVGGRPDADLERRSVDLRYAIAGGRTVPNDVTIVGIDDLTFSELNQRWASFPRRFHAQVIDRLHADGARVIAYDVQFTEPTTPKDDNALIEAVGRARNVVLTSTEVGPDGRTRIFGGDSVLRQVGARPANGNQTIDADRRIRHLRYSLSGLETLALVAAERATGKKIRPGDVGGGRAWIDFAGPPGTIPFRTFSRVLHGEFKPGTFRGKVVVVGPVAPTLGDLHETSVGDGPMSGPEIQANEIATALRGFPLKSPPRAVDIALLILIGLVIPLAALRLSPLLAFAVSIALAAAFALAVQLAFDHGVVLTFVYPAAALVLSALGALALELRVRLPARRARRRESTSEGIAAPEA